MSKHQVTSKQAPATEEEMAVTPVDLSSKVYGEDDCDDAAAEDGGPTVMERMNVIEFFIKCTDNLTHQFLFDLHLANWFHTHTRFRSCLNGALLGTLPSKGFSNFSLPHTHQVSVHVLTGALRMDPSISDC